MVKVFVKGKCLGGRLVAFDPAYQAQLSRKSPSASCRRGVLLGVLGIDDRQQNQEQAHRHDIGQCLVRDIAVVQGVSDLLRA